MLYNVTDLLRGHGSDGVHQDGHFRGAVHGAAGHHDAAESPGQLPCLVAVHADTGYPAAHPVPWCPWLPTHCLHRSVGAEGGVG